MTDHHFQLLKTRETCSGFNRTFQRRNNVSELWVNKLDLLGTLHGHEGCVNCLDWNYTGTLLASGSDDTKVIIWNFDGLQIYKKLDTMHSGNIFTVKFMPKNDEILVTGAADGKIFVHNIYNTAPVGAASVGGRVKKIVTDIIDPNIIISASEDGLINQYDIRVNLNTDKKTIINLSNDGFECKCLAISPTEPNHLAVGCDNPVIRLYDRRMLNGPNVVYFTPGHISRSDLDHEYVTTSLVFNASGNELLANMGNEHIYIFDVKEKTKPYMLPSLDITEANLKKCFTSSKFKAQIAASLRACSSSFHVRGNAFYDQQKYSAAIAMYNRSLLEHQNHHVFSNRAAAYIKRMWIGDHYAAMRDCCSALTIHPCLAKPHYRLARCLMSLEQVPEAKQYMDEFIKRHPMHCSSSSFVALQDSVKKALQESSPSSEKPCSMRQNAYDYKFRYAGHLNVATDIKEANFYGENGQYIIAGSDEGAFYMWEHDSTNMIRVMQADTGVVNCLQPHPLTPILATSGLDDNIKLWSPKMYTVGSSDFVVDNPESRIERNQHIMCNDSFDTVFGPLGIRAIQEDSEGQDEIGCRQS